MYLWFSNTAPDGMFSPSRWMFGALVFVPGHAPGHGHGNHGGECVHMIHMVANLYTAVDRIDQNDALL